MNKIIADFSQKCGKVKPMHSVNNGPAGSRVRGGNSTFHYFEEAGIPYARTHDASFYSGYGGEFTVDVHRIFRNFSADVSDPASYDFEVTDQYLKDIESVGTKVFYRLGASIEHGKKFGTFPPKDFQKWAEICEHIIRHYTEGWANGFYMDIEYWEIWNEPDCRNADGTNPCWQGTLEEFVDLFIVTLRHLKTCFPQLKIGGPAFCTTWSERWHSALLTAVKENNLPLDFYSFHSYRSTPKLVGECIAKAKAVVDKYGFPDTELILNEWNYVKGWTNEAWNYTLKSEKGLKGASFVASTMCVGQKSALGNLMYYDARPCGMNGMFNTDFLTPLKGYYPFLMFSKLYKLDSSIFTTEDCVEVYSTAALGDTEAALLVSYFDDDDNAPEKEIEIDISNLPKFSSATVEYYLLDEEHNCDLVNSETVSSNAFDLKLKMSLYSTCLIRIMFD